MFDSAGSQATAQLHSAGDSHSRHSRIEHKAFPSVLPAGQVIFPSQSHVCVLRAHLTAAWTCYSIALIQTESFEGIAFIGPLVALSSCSIFIHETTITDERFSPSISSVV